MEARVAIVGLGLIGGSLALALRRAWPGVSLLGVDSDPRTRELLAASGAVERVCDLEDADLATASLVVLAVPAAALLELIEPVAKRLAQGAVLTDVCGAKEEIVRRARQVAAAGKLAGQSGNGPIFVGGHPMAGTEFRGFQAASAGLFQGAVVALCPPVAAGDEAAAIAALERVRSLWTAAGAARIKIVDPEAHDRAVTFASHLPYLAAASVVDALLSAGASTELSRELAAGGFRDTTRVAGDWTLSGAAALNRFLPAAARELADRLAALADELRADPGRAVERLRALADHRRTMALPPRPGPEAKPGESSATDAPTRTLR